MSLMNKRDEYGWLAITLHWLLFILVVGMVASGKYSDSLSQDDKIIQIILVHKQVGIAVFLLMAFRFLWKLINTSPLSLTESGLLKFITFLVHLSLYVVVLGQALSGIAMSQLSGNPVAFLGLSVPTLLGDGGLLGAIPSILGDNAETAAGTLREFHGYGGMAIMVLVGLHIVGGVFHHMSGAETLRRMWFGYKPPYARETKSDQ